MSPRPAMPRLLVLAIAVAIAAAIVAIAVALFVLGAAVRRVDCSPALEPPAALQKKSIRTGVLEPAGGTKFGWFMEVFEMGLRGSGARPVKKATKKQATGELAPGRAEPF